jgi:glycosyltransferase involved in cell wall biosynthesis
VSIRRVVIVERQLLHYRTAFYNHLRSLLQQENVELQLLFGKGTQNEALKKDEEALDWAHPIPTRYLLGAKVCWQPFGTYARAADLVIVMHENKLLYNLWLLTLGRPQRIAFWGHGRNMQSDRPLGWKERFKRWTVNKVDWWFAYTETSAALVNAAGFPHGRTTVVDNASDTRKMAALCGHVTARHCQRLREQLALGDGPVGIYLGSLYREKRLDFLLESAQKIHDRIPGFRLLIVGAGPEQRLIEAAEKQHSWLSYLGPLQGKKKAEVLVLADVLLNPGVVGLGILDSFVGATPMFTTDCNLLSPEVSYLISGQNGVMTADDTDAYANAVATALSDPLVLGRLKQGALSSAPRYTIENMAERICIGILRCLSVSAKS